MTEQEINALIDALSASVRQKRDFDKLNQSFFSPGVELIHATITFCKEQDKSGNYGRIELTPKLDPDEFALLKELAIKLILRKIDNTAIERNKILTALATDEVKA